MVQVAEAGELNGCVCVEMDKSRDEAYQKQVIQESALKAMGEGPIVHFRIEK